MGNMNTVKTTTVQTHSLICFFSRSSVFKQIKNAGNKYPVSNTGLLVVNKQHNTLNSQDSNIDNNLKTRV